MDGLEQLRQVEYLIALQREVSSMASNVEGMAERLEAIEGKMDQVKQDLSRYRGIAGGMIWLGATAWGVFTVFKDHWR